jgi:hypothetical protein
MTLFMFRAPSVVEIWGDQAETSITSAPWPSSTIETQRYTFDYYKRYQQSQ